MKYPIPVEPSIFSYLAMWASWAVIGGIGYLGYKIIAHVVAW